MIQIDITVFTGSLCARARRMIADGADPATPIDWVRGGTVVFKRTLTLADWAKWSAVERDNQSVHMERYRPLPDRAKLQRGSATHGACGPAATQVAPEASAAVRPHAAPLRGNGE